MSINIDKLSELDRERLNDFLIELGNEIVATHWYIKDGESDQRVHAIDNGRYTYGLDLARKLQGLFDKHKQGGCTVKFR